MAEPSRPVLSVRSLLKRFGNATAVDGLSFEVMGGECFGLLGPNGAGKSTTLKLLLGLIVPDAGEVTLLGHSIPQAAQAARLRIGVVPQTDALDPDFTVAENLLVYARYFGIPGAQIRARLPALLEFAGLSQRASARVDQLSGGMRRRLTLARALVNDPDLLFLDEPTTGLDPQARHLIWDRLRKLLAAGKTIVLTTHFMEEAERLCSHLAIIDRGRRIALDTPRRLIQDQIEPQVVEVSGDQLADWTSDSAAQGCCKRIELVGDTAFAYCEDAGPVIATVEQRRSLRYLSRRANLEDVFLKLTGRDLRD
ncbi:MAG: ATP-binding cassette domain-containing protein [Quisquiliibacterium sp.]